MVDVREQLRPLNRLVCPAAMLSLLALTACNRLSVPTITGNQRVTAADFRSPDATPPATPIPGYTPQRRTPERVNIRSLTEDEANAGVGDLDVSIGDPALDQPAGDPEQAADTNRTDPAVRARRAPEINPDDLTVVEAKVGDLNGLPIIARSWLEPLGPRLRAESLQKSRGEWQNFAAKEIYDRLMASLQDELFLAEARAGLSDQERAGLRVFLQRFEQDVVRSSYGSQTLADEQLRRTSGIGLEEAKRERERLALVAQVRQRIRDRVQITSRDLELEYERSRDEFNPPPVAVFRLIRVRSADTEVVQAVEDALLSRPFNDVADDERNQTPEPATRELDGDLASTELFGLESLQEAAATLSPGAWAGPIDAGAFMFWVYLDRIEDNSRSLYDVQLELRQRIMEERGIEETRRYLLRLFERAGISNFDDLIIRLVQIAEEWYYVGDDTP